MLPCHVPSRVYAIASSSSHDVNIADITIINVMQNIDEIFFISLLFLYVYYMFYVCKDNALFLYSQ